MAKRQMKFLLELVVEGVSCEVNSDDWPGLLEQGLFDMAGFGINTELCKGRKVGVSLDVGMGGRNG